MTSTFADVSCLWDLLSGLDAVCRSNWQEV